MFKTSQKDMFDNIYENRPNPMLSLEETQMFCCRHNVL